MKTAKQVALYIAYRALRHTLELLAFFVSLFIGPKRAALPPIDDQNLLTPAIKLAQHIKSGHVTSEEVLESFINRIKHVNPLINAVVDKRFEKALKEAREIDRQIAAARNGEGDKSILEKPLLGLPISIKETISVDGHSHTGGLLGRKFVKAPKNAVSVDYIQQAGLIPMCLTNVPELAMWWDASNPVYGRTNNPYDLSRIPGGSSGGEGALLASAGSVIGIGNDIAGSIRIPANFCGIFGHKPTPYVVSNEGMYPLVKGDREKLLGMGPMTRYACDMLPLLKILAGPRASKLRLDEPVDLTKLKFYYIEDLGDPLASDCNYDILAGIRNAIAYMVNKYKCHSEKITFDEFKHGMFLWSAEANTEPNQPRMAQQFKGDSGAEMNPAIEIVKKCFGLSEHTTNSIMATTLELGSPNSGTKANRILCKKAADLRKKFNDLLGEDGILLVPTHPEPAPKHYTTVLKIFNVSYTSVTTILQGPITQCPLGLSKEGLPFGVQIMSKPYNDRLTLAVAQEFEAGLGGWIPPSRVNV